MFHLSLRQLHSQLNEVLTHLLPGVVPSSGVPGCAPVKLVELAAVLLDAAGR